MLAALVGKGQASAQKIKHANVLLKVDADGPGWGDEQAAEAFACAPRTVFRSYGDFWCTAEPERGGVSC